jgi:hypothetical protein
MPGGWFSPENFLEHRDGEVQQSPHPDGPGPPARKQKERAAQVEEKGGKRGPPQRCDTHNPTTAKRAAHLPGGHNQLYQVAISQSPLSPTPIGPGAPDGGSSYRRGLCAKQQGLGDGLRRICLLKLSEKGRRNLRCSPTNDRKGAFRPVLASPYLPNPRSECCSYPFSDSFSSHLDK